MSDVTGFTYTGTPTVTTAMTSTRTFTFGSTAGGTTSNALNLSLTSGAASPTIIGWFKTLDFTGSTCPPTTSNVYVDTLILATGGTYTGLRPYFTRTQTWTAQFSKALGAIGCYIPGGTLTLDGTQTLGASTYLWLEAGTLDLGGFNLTIGSILSNNTNTRSIAFGSNNIILSSPSSGNPIVDMANATGFTWSGTGGFSTFTTTVARTITFGSTAGGSATNAINLSITTGALDVIITDGSWFKTLNFTGSTSSLTTATKLYVDTLTLATGGTYTGLAPIFTRTQTWSPQYSKQLGGIGVGKEGVTLTLEATQTYTELADLYVYAGTLNLNSTNQTFDYFYSTGTGSRSITGGGSITVKNDWSVSSGSGFTGSDYTIKMNKATAKTFAGAGGQYGTLVQNGAGDLAITGSNSFADIQVI